ncbi:MAG TPA: type II toxin-antitoxin system PemK/MazF family toxin [Desulfosporosinus sp.]|nr:type II toxin-antitoxin system PemK/MazF family toxin [Desulfosporosinus sp.]
MAELLRGEIYYIKFPYTFDRRYPDGKSKFVLVLQEGEYFKDYDTVEVLLITSDSESKGFLTNVTIEKGTTLLKIESYIVCAQPYPVRRTLFEEHNVWCAGKLSPEKMDEVDEAIYIGLCMDHQNIE